MAFDKSKFIPRFVQESREHLKFLSDELQAHQADPTAWTVSGDCVRAAHTVKGSAKILGLKPISEVAQHLEEVLRAIQKQTVSPDTAVHELLLSTSVLLTAFISQIELGEEIETDITGVMEDLESALRGEYKPLIEENPAEEVPPAPPLSSKEEPAAPPVEAAPPPVPEKKGGFDKSKFVARFVEEARDHINTLNEGLINLETQPGNLEIIDQIFRVAHTLKGASKILGLKPVSLLAHKVEDVLDSLRNDRVRFNKPLCDLLLKSVDLISEFVEQIAAGQSPDTDIRPLIEALESAARGEPVTALKPSAQSVSGEEDETGLVRKASDLPQTLFKTATSDTVRISTNKLDDTVKLMGEIVSNHIRMKQNVLDIDELSKLFNKHLDQLAPLAKSEQGPLNGRSSEIVEMARAIHTRLKTLSSHTRDVMSFQSLVTDDLREKVLRMRMLPLSTVLDGFPRLVRDIADACGKQVRLDIQGAGTELDKKIIERIGDPLLHMVRNSIDHGIEPPEVRRETGKEETGTVRVSAEYEGGHVLIRIEDDGTGISVEKIREKAVMKKIYDEETVEGIPDAEIINLIFRPGFSTSTLITEVSGRGVGMDVVRDNIVKHLKGSVQIESKKDKGTTFFIRLPLTLAVMRLMLVRVGSISVAIPLNSIREIIRVPAESLIEVVNRHAVSLRDQIIPVAELKTLLDLEETDARQDIARPGNNLVILLVAMGTEMLGLIVDEIETEEDMEIKPLPDHMKDNELVSGITLSGRNEIVLVLQAPRLFTLARTAQEEKFRHRASVATKEFRILVVDDSVSTRHVEKNILEAQGYQVELAADGVEGFEKAMEKPYDLILTDIEMPRMDGFTLTEALRQEKTYRHTPIIILSSRGSEEDKLRGMQVGANGYLVKGAFDPQQLTDTINKLMQ